MKKEVKKELIKKFIKPENLEQFFEQFRKNDLKNKVKTKLVFTNGCFDILHRGHLEYLIQAKELGDKLIIALNSDKSIKALKGKDRPINKLDDRVFALSALFFVDYVTYFDELTPINIIAKIKPDIHVKGGDYKKENLPEYSIIKSYGGEIIILDYVNGYSTTKIIENIKNIK